VSSEAIIMLLLLLRGGAAAPMPRETLWFSVAKESLGTKLLAFLQSRGTTGSLRTWDGRALVVDWTPRDAAAAQAVDALRWQGVERVYLAPGESFS
jgi:hypothetical protein